MVNYILSTGSHDSYKVIGVFTGPDDIDLQALIKQWTKDHPDKVSDLNQRYTGKEHLDLDHFKEYLLNKTGLMEVQHKELWLPDYWLDMKRVADGTIKVD